MQASILTTGVMRELESLLAVLESQLPANPQDDRNVKLANPFEREMREYFRTLEQAFPYSDVLAIFGPIVATQGGQTESRRPHKAEIAGSTPAPARLLEADPWDGPIELLLATFSKQLQARLTARLLNIYVVGSAQMIEWGRTKTTDRPIFNEGPPMRQAFEYADARSARLVTNMNIETKNRLAKVVGDSIRDKEGIPGLARKIRTEFDDMTKYRSQMVARTETADALEQAFMDRSRDIGVTGKRWVVSDPCDVCMANGNVGTVPLDEAPYFDTNGNHILRPPAHPNCRCALAPIMLEATEADRARTPKGTFASGSGEFAGMSRSERAKATHRPATAATQRQGEAHEGDVAKAISGQRTGDNKPFDVVKGNQAVEVKTIVPGAKAPKITMHPDSLRRKQVAAKKNKWKSHTVVFDDRNGSVLYKKGVGSFRLNSMKVVTLADLPRYIK